MSAEKFTERKSWKFRCPVCGGSHTGNASGYWSSERAGIDFDCCGCGTGIQVRQNYLPEKLYADIHAEVARETTETGEVKVRRGRPRLELVNETLRARKPWVEKGMSRTTWFRRQREKRDGNT
jgi:hypothetical protein